jgi:hypothetical protein
MWQEIRVPLLMALLSGIAFAACKFPRVFRASLFPALMKAWTSISVVLWTWAFAVLVTRDSLQPFLATQKVVLAHEAVDSLLPFSAATMALFSMAGSLYLFLMCWLAEKIEHDRQHQRQKTEHD